MLRSILLPGSENLRRRFDRWLAGWGNVQAVNSILVPRSMTFQTKLVVDDSKVDATNFVGNVIDLGTATSLLPRHSPTPPTRHQTVSSSSLKYSLKANLYPSFTRSSLFRSRTSDPEADSFLPLFKMFYVSASWVSGSCKKRHYISRMGVVDCSIDYRGLFVQRFRPWDNLWCCGGVGSRIRPVKWVPGLGLDWPWDW